MPGTIRSRRLSLDLQDQKTRARAIEEIAEAFEESEGVGVDAAEYLDVSYRALTTWMGKYPKLEQKVRWIRDKHGASHQVGEDFRSQAHRKK